MGYIEYRFKPMIKPAMEILLILCVFGSWAMGGYYFTHYIWVPTHDAPINNMYDVEINSYWTYETRYENGYGIYLVASIIVFAIAIDYHHFRRIGNKTEEK